MIKQGKLSAVFIPDAVVDKVRLELYPDELKAIREFGRMRFDSV